MANGNGVDASASAGAMLAGLPLAHILRECLRRVVFQGLPWCRSTSDENRAVAFVGVFKSQAAYELARDLLTQALDLEEEEALARVTLEVTQ